MTERVSGAYTSGIDGKLAAESAAVFRKLPDSAKEEAKTSRANLYAWLVDLDGAVRDTTRLVTKARVEEASKLVASAIPAATAEQQRELAASILTKFITDVASECKLVSRQGPGFPWEQTGFHYDGSVQAVFAKVGKAPYQPIGHDDGTHYVPRESSNLLWRRQWGLSYVVAHQGPFQCVTTEDDPTAYAPARLTERELTIINEGITALNEELDNLKTSDDASRSEAEFRVRETIKLARIQIPKLDFRMSSESDKRPELGANFENVDAFVLGGVVLEYLSLLLDEHAAREGVTRTALVNRSAEQVNTELKAAILTDLNKLLAQENPDDDALASTITKASVSVHGIREILDAMPRETTVVDAARQLAAYLSRPTATPAPGPTDSGMGADKRE